MAQARGIEIFGRGATVVDDTSRSGPRRGPWLGLLSLLLGVLAAASSAVGVLLVLGGDVEAARVVAYAGIGCGALGVVIGFVALVGNRGVMPAVWGLLLGLVGNPWSLTRILEAAGSLLA